MRDRSESTVDERATSQGEGAAGGPLTSSDVRRMAFSVALLFSFLFVVAACSQKPDDPAFDNPFDPRSPDAGSQYSLAATFEADTVRVRWELIESVDSWELRSSSSEDRFEDMERIIFVTKGTAGADSNVVYDEVDGLVVYSDVRFQGETANWYALRGVQTQSGDGSVRGGEMVPSYSVMIDAPIVARPKDGIASVSTRNAVLEVKTFVSEQVEIAHDEAFTESRQLVDVTPGVLTDVPVVLPDATTATATLKLYVRAVMGGVPSATRVVDYRVGFDPGIEIVSGVRVFGTQGLVAVHDTVRIRLVGEDVDRVWATPVFDDSDGLAVAEYPVPTELAGVGDVFLLPVPDIEGAEFTFAAFFEGEFGIDREFAPDGASLFEYDVLESISFTVVEAFDDVSVGVRGDEDVTTERDIVLELSADGAFEMIVSEDPAFADTDWVAFADTLAFTISPEAGEKTIYAAFRNSYLPDRPAASTGITYLAPPSAAVRAGGQRGADQKSGRIR